MGFLRVGVFFFFVCSGVIAQGAFFNIRQKEKDELITCGLYLYLTKNNIDCADESQAITEAVYKDFLAALTIGQAFEMVPNDAVTRVSPVFKDFESFKENIVHLCKNARNVCTKIQTQTQKTPIFERKKCDSLCSANTCRDAFTLSACYAMSIYGNEGQKGTSPICPQDTVKNCLKNKETSLPDILKNRGWPDDWRDLKTNWDKVFLLTATEPAKGRHLGIRAIQGGAVIAVMAAMPFIIHAIWPALPVLKFSWSSLFSWGNLKKKVGSIFNVESSNIQSTIYTDATQKIVGEVASTV